MSEKKTAKDSIVIMQHLVMPNDTNPHNTIFGGVVMSWIDMAAALCAEKYTRKNVVTVHVSDISFKAPIRIGDHVTVMAKVNYVGKTSLVIGTKVIAENPQSGEKRHTSSAYLTFVSLDDIGRPVRVPELILETEDDKRRAQEAKDRVDRIKKGR